jgi:hypothetical protein
LSSKNEINELRSSVAQLYPKRDIGDLTEREFQKRLDDKTVALYRAIIKKKMAESETIQCEHHAIWTHFRLMQSILREPAQQGISLFLTDKRLYRVQSTLLPDRPPTADSRDNTIVDSIPLDRITGLKKRYQIRIGEISLGAIFCGIAYLFYDLLSITGPILFGFGMLGVLHGLILPTKWIEVQTNNTKATTDPILIYAIRWKSAKEMVRRLQEKLRASCPK